MSRRSATVVVATAVLGALLAGCAGGAADQPGQDTTAPQTGTASPTAPDTAGTTDPTDPTDPIDPADYLPVPDGVELTEPGTELSFRDGAFAAWQPRQDLVGVVGVTVLKVEQTTVKKSLQGFDLDPAAAASTPYFVSTLVGNGGETDLGGRQLPFYVVDSDGRLVPPTGVDQAFEPCPGSVLPAIFAPGDRARSCLIFLVPSGAELASVMFRPPEGVVPLTWTGKVKQLGAAGDTKGRGKGKGKGKGKTDEQGGSGPAG